MLLGYKGLPVQAHILKLLDQSRNSFWIIPLGMCIIAIVLSWTLTKLDTHQGVQTWVATLNLFSTDPDGARATLSTIASVMMGTAGVVFSIVIVVLSLASSQFGPRMPRSFVHDRVNQVTLGTFVSTFLYCLLVLSAIDKTVPVLSLGLACLLAIANILVLIIFIHHTSQLIQAPHVINAVGREMDTTLNRLFPAQQNYPADEHPEFTGDIKTLSKGILDGGQAIRSNKSGYVQTLGFSSLYELAQGSNAAIYVLVRPGDYCLNNQVLALYAHDEEMSSNMADRIRGQILLGNNRTPIQDLAYAIDQLQEIALRALSPGINDPFTAINAIDRMASGLVELCQRKAQREVITDKEGIPRLLTNPISRENIIDSAFSPLRNHAIDHIPVCRRLIEMAGAIAALTPEQHLREALMGQARLMRDTVAASNKPRHDIAHLEAKYQTMMEHLEKEGIQKPVTTMV